MAEKNPYFPHLFEPLKVGSKIIKNRIEAAPALFAFDHYIELDPDPFGYTTPVPERAFRMLEAKAKGGAGIVCLGELSPNHEYDKRFPFEPRFRWVSCFPVVRSRQISEMALTRKDHPRKIFRMAHT